VAAAVSAGLGDYQDAIAIVAIVILNAALGFRQEYKAEKTMLALRRLAAPVVRVRRAGAVRETPAASLVPGDIVLVEAGNVIPADARLLRSASLRVQEAALGAGLEPDLRAWHPHITMARCRNVSAESVRPFLKANAEFEAGLVRVESFALYSSIPGPVGSAYTRELQIFSSAG
jgi:hypothetical protein